jgi:hypothetical protein
MNPVLCTIVTPSHIYKGITNLMSLRMHDQEAKLYLIVTQPVNIQVDYITVLPVSYFVEKDYEAQLITQIYHNYPDAIRWCMKPIVMRYLIKKYEDATVIYADADTYFFQRPNYLYLSLIKGGIFLTPHWRPLWPSTHLDEFRANFCDGLFNAGLIAANAQGINALNWWSVACISGCEHSRPKGIWGDQKYLDLMVIYFPETVICREPGYNVADWNVQIRDAYLKTHQNMDDFYEIVCVHFTDNTIKLIQTGGDSILEPFLKEYLHELSLNESKYGLHL